MILKSISIPEEAYYRPRKRYRSEKLINIMTEKLKGQYTRVLVLTEKDISTSVHGREDWGILGQAALMSA